MPCARRFGDEPGGVAKAEVEAYDEGWVFAGLGNEPGGDLVAGAACFNADFAVVGDGGDDVAALACGVDAARTSRWR